MWSMSIGTTGHIQTSETHVLVIQSMTGRVSSTFTPCATSKHSNSINYWST